MADSQDHDDPVVIVGMSVRFPGDATSPDKFWQMLCEGRSAHGPVPSERFNVASYYHPVPGHTGSLYVKDAHFIRQDIAAFDPQFFSISPKEAVAMDPQQRMLLELVYEGLENAGITIEQANGSRTACYVGAFTREYETMLARDEDTVSPYQATGAGFSMLANRVSWFFNFKGPSVSLDTACSSSLTGFHLGCQNLHTGEAEMVRLSHPLPRGVSVEVANRV
jgi:acyl transferase domain-containing protein